MAGFTITPSRDQRNKSYFDRDAERAPPSTDVETNGHHPPHPITPNKDVTTKPFIPPYWTAHQRTVSNVSYCSVQTKVRRHLISLEDNSGAEAEERNTVWAKSVTIEDYVIVGAGVFGEWRPGSYVTWNCTIETLEGGPITLIKRYSEFDELRQRLHETFPLSDGALPPLPPKSVISKFRSKFLEKRKEGLLYFLNCVLLNPEFGGSRVLKDWVFATA